MSRGPDRRRCTRYRVVVPREKYFATARLSASYTNPHRPVPGRATLMEPNQQAEAQTELVTETLVEEVSIDGMCGVY